MQSEKIGGNVPASDSQCQRFTRRVALEILALDGSVVGKSAEESTKRLTGHYNNCAIGEGSNGVAIWHKSESSEDEADRRC